MSAITVLNPFQSIHFNQYYSQSTYTMDDFITSSSGNVNFIQYDKILDTDTTMIDSTITFGSGSPNYYMRITQGTSLNTSFWKRRRTPGSDIFIKIKVTHSGTNTIGLNILGNLVTLDTSGNLSITGGPTLNITGHTSTSRVTIYIKVFNTTMNLTVVTDTASIYSLTFKVNSVPDVCVVGFGTGIYTTFQTRLMKNALGCFMIGSSLIASSTVLTSLSNKQQLFDKNIIVQNFAYNAASISSGIQNQINSILAIQITNGSNVVVIALQIEQINMSAADPINSFVNDISNIVSSIINTGMSVWVISMMAFQTADIAITQQVNEAISNIQNIKLLDISSALINNTTGIISSVYFTTSVSGPILTSSAIEIMSKYMLLWLYDELDSEQYISRLGADNIVGNGTSISQNIYQGSQVNIGTFSGVFSNHLYLDSNNTNSILFRTTNNNNSDLPIVSGTRPNSSRVIYQTTSTFDTSRGINTNLLWDSVDGTYNQYTSGVLTLTNNIGHFNLLHKTTIGSGTNPTGNLGTFNIVGDTCSNGAIFFTQTTNGTPTLNTRNIGTRVVLKSNTTNSTCDTAIGVDAQNGLWISNGNTFNVYQNNTIASSFNLTQSTIKNSLVVLNSNNTKSELALCFTNGSTYISNNQQAFRLRVDTTNSVVFEQATGSTTGISIFTATTLYGLGASLILNQNTFFNVMKSSNVFTVSSNSVTTDTSQAGVIIVPTSNFSNSMVLPQTATFTLNNQFIRTTSVVLLTPSSTNILSSTFVVCRTHNISNGSIIVDVSILSGTSPPAANILVHYLIN